MAPTDIPAITPPEIPAYIKARYKLKVHKFSVNQHLISKSSQKPHAKKAKPPVLLQNKKKEETHLENSKNSVVKQMVLIIY